jgi:hypothetical protein
MNVLPAQQRALLKMERSLRKDPGLAAALDAFSRRRFTGAEPRQECVSPWHPVLWRAVPMLFAASLLALIVLGLVLALGVGRPGDGQAGACRPLAVGCSPGAAGRAAHPRRAVIAGSPVPVTSRSAQPPARARVGGSDQLLGSPLHGVGALRRAGRTRR